MSSTLATVSISTSRGQVPPHVASALGELHALYVQRGVTRAHGDHFAGRRQGLPHGGRSLATKRLDLVARHDTDLDNERDRLAREVHDVLSHTLGAVQIQLTALDSRLAAGDGTAEVRERVAALHRLVGESLDDAREAVHALRKDNPPLIRRLRRLCDLHGTRFDVHGQTRALPAGASLTLYRVAQEALTNVEKHAPGAPASLRLSFAAEAARIRIDNERTPGPPSPLASTGGGYGVRGMRERVELAGGRLRVGPTAEGWTVAAEIPA